MDFAGKRNWFFLVSGLVILAGLISMLFPPSLRLGIDFVGGTSMTVS